MNCMRHSSTCYDLRSAAPFGIAYLRSVAFVRGHGCFLLSLMAVFRAHVFFSDNRREASKNDRTTERRSYWECIPKVAAPAAAVPSVSGASTLSKKDLALKIALENGVARSSFSQYDICMFTTGMKIPTAVLHDDTSNPGRVFSVLLMPRARGLLLMPAMTWFMHWLLPLLWRLMQGVP